MAKYICTCGAKYTFPDASAGKRAKCKKCGAVFTLPDSDPHTMNIADDDAWEADEATTAAEHADDYARAVAQAQSRGLLQTVVETSDAAPNAVSAPHTRGYAGSIIDTLLFPTSLGNLFIFLVIWFAMFVVFRIPVPRPFAIVLILALTFWYAAYRFQIVRGGAAGDRDLPEIEFTLGDILDYVLDAWRWLASWLFVLVPAIGYLAWMFQQGNLTVWEAVALLFSDWSKLFQSYADYPVFVILTLAGTLLWPMVVLCVALGGFDAVWRIDLMLLTISRSLAGYLMTCTLWAAAIGLSVAGDWLVEKISTTTGGAIGTEITLSALNTGVALYAEIVSLRLIGLYYRHFKDQFAWDWG